MKLRVYTDGFDGHCLRAHSYFSERMPDIHLPSETDICYKANVGGTNFWFTSSQMIDYGGTIMTGEAFYALVTNQKL